MKLFFIIMFLFISCGDNKTTDEEIVIPGNPLNMNLEGVWETCQSEDTNSQSIFFAVRGEEFIQTIKNYNSSIDCSGLVSSELTFQGSIIFDAFQKSSFEPNATNYTLTLPGEDLFGCGEGQPAYSYLRILDNSGFHSALSSPSCNPDVRGNGLGMYFIKISE